MNPISVSAVANKNGVITIFVLMDDGSILKKSENDNSWTQIDAVSGYRNEPIPQPNLVSSNKGRKKRGN